MKLTHIFFLLISFAMFTACNNAPKGDKAETTEAGKAAIATGKTFTVNTNGSLINWTGSKIGSSHSGTIVISDGSVTVDKNAITGGKFTIDMNSLVNTDLGADMKGKLEGHLKSPDFFDVAVHPKGSFEITQVKTLENDPAASHLVYGNLTLKGITKQVGFRAKLGISNNGVSVSTPDFTIDRTDFNIKYGSSKFFDNLKDKAINDNIGLKVVLQAS